MDRTHSWVERDLFETVVWFDRFFGNERMEVTERPAWIAQNYRVLARYRRNVYRKWLFLEGEPDIHWPRKEDGSRKPVWGATLRVEILFTGAGPDPQDGGGSGP